MDDTVSRLGLTLLELDPIDGTRVSCAGDQYAVAWRWWWTARCRSDVLGCPRLTAARTPEPNGPGACRGGARPGAWTTSLAGPGEFERLKTSPVSEPSRRRVLRSFEAGHTNGRPGGRASARRWGHGPKRCAMDSQAKYRLLAAGAGRAVIKAALA